MNTFEQNKYDGTTSFFNLDNQFAVDLIFSYRADYFFVGRKETTVPTAWARHLCLAGFVRLVDPVDRSDCVAGCCFGPGGAG